MEWNSIVTRAFIEDYRESPELWNSNTNDYKDLNKRKKRLHQLAVKYGLEVNEAKSKIKNLRSAYHRERKNAILHGRKVKWFAYKALDFLKDVDSTVDPTNIEMVVANPAFEIKIEQQEDNDGNDKESNGGEDIDTPLQNALNTDLFADSSEADKSADLFYSTEASKPDNPPNKRFKKRKETSFLDFDEDSYTTYHPKNSQQKGGSGRDETASFYHHKNPDPRITESLSYCHNNNTEQKIVRDEFSTYGEYVGNELRHLSYRSQVMAKHIINNTLFEAAMGKYETDVASASDANTLQECTATVTSGST